MKKLLLRPPVTVTLNLAGSQRIADLLRRHQREVLPVNRRRQGLHPVAGLNAGGKL